MTATAEREGIGKRRLLEIRRNEQPSRRVLLYCIDEERLINAPNGPLQLRLRKLRPRGRLTRETLDLEVCVNR
jgi:hypothetical protein